MNLAKTIRELKTKHSKKIRSLVIFFKCGDFVYKQTFSYDFTPELFVCKDTSNKDSDEWLFKKVNLKRFEKRNYPNTPWICCHSVIVSRYLKRRHKNNIEILDID